jgi:peptidoglycan/xylan/chitin deacetylase (PgdA/CDA1 family)
MAAASFRPLVLCYHSVSDDWCHDLAVTVSSFERQVTGLRRRFSPLTASQILDGPRKGLHVTFDDAYRDILQIAPLLDELEIRPTVFAATGFADEGRPLNVPELIEEANARPQRLATMQWSDLGELTERGWEIGSHTISHPHLPALSDHELERELVESRERIESQLGRPCRLLAYPFGDHDRRVQELARRTGYAAAFGLWTGTHAKNRWALPRIDLYRNDSPIRARLKTSFLKPSASRLLDLLENRA